MKNQLLNEIVKATRSRQSINFYRKAIRQLGEDRIRLELGELKYQIHQGKVRDPGKYFTWLLKDALGSKESIRQATGRDLATYKPAGQQQLFAELKLQDETAIDRSKTALDIPYLEDKIKFPTLLSNSFFTLHTDKTKSDEIPVKLRTLKGDVEGILVRGRIKMGAKETGILTVFDGRVFLAVLHIWQKKGCETSLAKMKSGLHLSGVVNFSVAELTRKVYPNITSVGGKEYLELINSLQNLSYCAYAIYYPNDGTEMYHGFRLLGMLSISGIRRGRQTESTGISVMISPEVTRQYLKQRYLNRPEQLTRVRGEIAFLLWLYLEPKLESIESMDMPIEQKYLHKELRHLIKELRLPKASWHKYPSQRKRYFEEAIKELKDKKTGSGKRILLRIDNGLYDYVLTARLSRT